MLINIWKTVKWSLLTGASSITLLVACASPTPTAIATQIPTAISTIRTSSTPVPTSTITPIFVIEPTVSQRALATLTATITPSPTTPPYRLTEEALSFTHLIDFTFIDSETGWVLAADCFQEDCPATIRMTQDGGRTWVETSAPLVEANSYRSSVRDSNDFVLVNALRFATRVDGWAFGSSLFSTHDGGLTWTDENRTILALEVADKAIWAIERHENTAVILRSLDLGRTWVKTDGQPIFNEFSALFAHDVQTAWLFVTDKKNQKLVATHDGGKTWQESSPLPNCFWPASTVDPGFQLWLICGGSVATAMQDKRVYVSNDDGMTWELRAESGSISPDIGNISSSGHVGGAENFTAVSMTHAFLALGRSGLLMTVDGGRTWTMSLQDWNMERGIGPVRFVDTQHGWLGTDPNYIFRTTDGGITWETILIP